PAYRDAAERAGGFILLAQMPEPQPAWAQQYDAQMQPAWARKFEPPSITGGESQGVMKILLRLYQETGDKKYLEPIPRACRYLQASRLSDGRLARFYELRTNKPLFFTKQYELTYSDADLPTHYGFKISDGTESILREHERLSKLPREQVQPKSKLADEVARRPKSGPSQSLIQQTKATIAALDDRGRWVEDGKLSHHGDDDPTRRIIDCGTFSKHMQVLSNYLAATKEQ
ncbi:MAG: pectate lyase, partial [Pirellulales bacterium]